MTFLLRVVRGWRAAAWWPQDGWVWFPPGEYVFGRAADSHVLLNCTWVSRHHCVLRVADEEAAVQDLDSLHGTLVNGRKVAGEVVLSHRDQLQVGSLAFQVRIDRVSSPDGWCHDFRTLDRQLAGELNSLASEEPTSHVSVQPRVP